VDRSGVWIPYCGAAPAPAELMAKWNLDPVLLGMLMICAVAAYYMSRRGAVRGWYSALVIALLTILFVSPFCALTSALFAARTVHHLALTIIVAPLLALALPVRQAGSGLMGWTLSHAAAVWLWHWPGAYDQALSSTPVYWLMQASLLITGVGFWRALRSTPVPLAIAALLFTMVQMGLLGALLTVSSRAYYAPHATSTFVWDLAPLEDQQLAGLIMWAPGAGFYLAAALVLLSRWFARERQEALAA